MAEATTPIGDSKVSDLVSTLDGFRRREGTARKLSGKRFVDHNDPDRFLIVVASNLFYSIDAKDFVDAQANADGVGMFWIRNGAEVWKTKISAFGSAGAAADDAEALEVLHRRRPQLRRTCLQGNRGHQVEQWRRRHCG